MDKWLSPKHKNLLENGNFSDCQIIVEKKQFNCHKVILSSASEYFERMFLTDCKESKSNIVELEDIEPSIFEILLEYIYTYDADKLFIYNTTIMVKLLEYGSRFLVPSMISDCIETLEKKAQVVEVNDLVSLVQCGINIQEKKLLTLVETKIQNNVTKFRNSGNCFEVLQLTSDAFEVYNKMMTKVLRESERFKMIETYVTHNGNLEEQNKEVVDLDDDNNIKKFKNLQITQLLDTIDYSEMEKEEFYNIVGKSSLLTYKQKFEYSYLLKETPRNRSDLFFRGDARHPNYPIHSH